MSDPASPLGRAAIDLAQGLVRIPSVNPPGDVRECAEALIAFFREADVPVETVHDDPARVNVVARLTGTHPGPRLLLNGHLDVVPATSGWTAEPFGGEIRDGRLTGRGAVDMKSGLAAMAAALAELRRRGAPRRGEILLTAVADEETGSHRGTRLLTARGLRADAAIVGEPTNLDLSHGNRGSWWATVTFHGRSSHAARPHLAVNAVAAAAEFVRLVEAFSTGRTDERFEVPHSSLTATMIQGGVKSNVVPDLAVVTVDRRTLPGESSATAAAELEGLLRRIERSGLRTELEIHPAYEAYVIDGDAPVLRALVRACERVLGRTPAISAKAGATDGSHLYHAAGIPAAIFGPGDATRAHTADEAVEVSQIAAAAAVYVEAAAALIDGA